jgi:teichuronic acid biosynthesis glycosyltransferase TuaG
MQYVPVSVIIPCYRCVGTIERALLSIVHQTMVPMEIIFVEDFSGDGGRTLVTLNRLKARYEKETCSMQVISLEKNGGPSVARNAGWSVSRHPHVAFLDADDAWHPKKMEIQYGWMEQHPEVTLTCHGSIYLRSDQSVPELPDTVNYRPVSRIRLLLSNKIATRSVMLKRDIPFRFEIEKRHGEDYHLWLEILFNGYSVIYLDLPLCYSYQPSIKGSGLSADLWQMEKGELDAYRRLFREKLISLLAMSLLFLVSFVKYTRRLIIKFTFLRNEPSR